MCHRDNGEGLTAMKRHSTLIRLTTAGIAAAGLGLFSACKMQTFDPVQPRKSSSRLSTITMPVPDKLKSLIGPNKINAYSLVITPGNCDAGVTGTSVEKIAQELDLNGATLANEKIKQGCDYTLVISLGKADAGKTKLEKVYLTNDAQDKRTEISADQTRSSKIKVTALVFVTQDAKTDLGINDQAIIVPSVNESDLDIDIDIGPNGSNQNQQQQQDQQNPPGTGNQSQTGDYDWKAFAKLSDVPTYPFSGNDYGSEFYRDIMNHTAPRDRYLTDVSSTQAHESLHGMHAAMRNITRDKDAFFYYQGGKGIYVIEPKENSSDIKNHIGASFKQLAPTRYKTYLIDQVVSWTNTLYIFDEWSAYIATTRSAVESYRAGKWNPAGNSDPVEGLADFMYFCSAAILSIKNVDPSYLAQNTQFKAAYAMIMEESVKWVNEAKKESIWQNSKAWAKVQNLQTASDAAQVRAAVKDLMGAAWTQRVLGF
jgi:hypothetical protein